MVERCHAACCAVATAAERPLVVASELARTVARMTRIAAAAAPPVALTRPATHL
jgi:hypothetical protein